MSDQKTPEEVKQSLLDQIAADKKAVETLSDEELEAVAGGGLGLANTTHIVNMNTGAAVSRHSINTGVVKPINTGMVRPRQPLKGIEPEIE